MKCTNCGVRYGSREHEDTTVKGSVYLCKDCYSARRDSNGRFTKGSGLGSYNGMWKGDDVGYHGVHDWIKSHWGKPEICEHCDAKNLGGKRHQWANISGEYKRDRSDWIRLCAKCHYRFDGRDKNLESNQKAKIRSKLSNNKSGYKNVRITKYGKYRAYISVDKKQVNLGSYRTPQEAHQVYKEAALRLYGMY